MSVPFGTRKKKPEQHAACFIAVCDAYVSEKMGIEFNKKSAGRFQKYMERMLEIMGGKCKKCPNTTVRT